MPIRFGEFVLDPRRRLLLRGEEPVHLTPKAFELLAALLDRRPQAVARDELEGRIWGRTHVAETSLAGLVAELRAALDDRARPPRFVHTVHGFGYAFSAAATGTAEAEARDDLVYRIAWDRREVALRPGENVLGRDDDVVAWIDSPTVSRRHARILIAPEGAVLEDLGSRNGTYLRGEKIAAPAPLRDRDEIRLGSVVMTFRMTVPSETESQG
ncbi:MAG TPA: FHA domain-containing protein [Vicinamibacteria bacterium]|nr:FHA domain-containing protein [Vicinamibacteria bacterium]